MQHKYIIYLFLFIFLASCNSDKKKPERYITESSGNINGISLVADNLVWEGLVGEKVREIFAAPLLGLPQDEPIFNIRQIPEQVFDGFATKNRLILKIEKRDSTAVSFLKDVYAKPQTVVLLVGQTDEELISQLVNNKDRIINEFNKQEVKEKRRRINKSLLNDVAMEQALKFKIDIPSAYRIALNEDNFYWVRKSLTNTMTMDFMFYDVPMNTIRDGDSAIIDIVRLRDSISKSRIPGEDGMIMSTEDAYIPSMFETSIDGHMAYETRGMWEIKGEYMAGPFINYAIKDEANNRFIIAEGYVYAPSLNKREYIFEQEAIIKSISFEK
ncbi:MAG: DUF4837 family protein [Bacteroidota bacterium]